MKLAVENGGFAYRDGPPVLKDMNFSVCSGDLLAILGPNGAGKTTLLRCIAGFLKWSAGRGTLDGTDIRMMPERGFWKRAAYVPQARGAQLSLTALEMVMLGRANRLGLFSAPKKEDEEESLRLMERLKLSGLADKRCTELSGGEYQMVLIARAMAARPELLILDEPESGLDFRNQLLVLNALSGLAADGMCCIFNTHYPAHALARAGKSLLLCRGGGYFFGETASVVTGETIETAFGVKAAVTRVNTPEGSFPAVVPIRLAETPPSSGGAEFSPRTEYNNPMDQKGSES